MLKNLFHSKVKLECSLTLQEVRYFDSKPACLQFEVSRGSFQAATRLVTFKRSDHQERLNEKFVFPVKMFLDDKKQQFLSKTVKIRAVSKPLKEGTEGRELGRLEFDLSKHLNAQQYRRIVFTIVFDVRDSKLRLDEPGYMLLNMRVEVTVKENQDLPKNLRPLTTHMLTVPVVKLPSRASSVENISSPSSRSGNISAISSDKKSDKRSDVDVVNVSSDMEELDLTHMDQKTLKLAYQTSHRDNKELKRQLKQERQRVDEMEMAVISLKNDMACILNELRTNGNSSILDKLNNKLHCCK